MEGADPYKKIMAAAPPLAEPKNLPKTPDEELVQTPEEIERDAAIEKRAKEIFEARKTANPKGTEKEIEPSTDDYVTATNEIVNRGGAKGPGVVVVHPTGAPVPLEVPPAASSKPETPQEKEDRKEFEKIRKEFDENEKKIAETRHKAKGRLRIIGEALGIWKRKVEDEEINTYLDNRKSLYPKLKAAGRQALSGNEKEWAEFETEYHETTIAIKSRLEEDGIRAKEARYSNVFVGLANVSKNYRGFISKQFLKNGKLTVTGVAKGLATAAAIGFAATSLIAASLPALGVVAVGSAGWTAAMAWRAFGSMGAGYAAKKRMEMGFVEKKEKEVQADVLEIIKAKKEKTDEEWKAFIAEREGIKSVRGSIAGEEQVFADADARHKRWALLIAGGTMALGTIMSNYVAPHAKGLFGQAWDKVFGGGKPGIIAMTGTEVPAGAGKGAAIPEKVKFWGAAHKIEAGTRLNNPWAVTREMYMDHARGYGYDSNDPRIHRWFNSYNRSGILRRLGIRVHNFDQLSEANKLKIWAEHETATSIRDFKVLHGGKAIPDLVHDGDSVILNGDHTVELQADSGIKAGHSHHDVLHVPKAAAADHYPRGASVHEAAGKRPAWLEALDNNRQKVAQENFAKKAAISAQTHEALVQSRGPLIANRIAETAAIDNTQTHKWMDFIQERIYGKGTTVDWREPASEFRKRMLGSFLTSDQPMGPPANVGEQQQYWRAAQELNRKLGPTLGNESTESWLQRGLAQGKVTPEEIIRTLKRVVNA